MIIGQINDQILNFQMNSAGAGNLSIISRADGKFQMIFNELLNDVVGSDCNLRFFDLKGESYDAVEVAYECFYTVYTYRKGVEFVKLEADPASASEAAPLSKWPALIFCLFVTLPLMRS